MTNRSIEFYITGEPQAKGSMSAFLMGWPSKTWSQAKRQIALAKLSKSILSGRYPTITVTSTNRTLKTWETKVRNKAEAAMAGESSKLTNIRAYIVFYMKRPSNHFGTGKNDGVVKDWATKLFCTKKPDIDKLERGIYDACNGIVFEDDCEVVEVVKRKKWGTNNGAVVKMMELNDVTELESEEQQLLFDIEQYDHKMNGVLN